MSTETIPVLAEIEQLHSAYCESMAVELPLTQTFIRWWWEARKMNITPDDVRLVVKSRMRFNLSSSCKKSLELKNLIRSDDDISIMLNEVAIIHASSRIKIMDKGKASVLRATGRVAEVPDNEAKPVGDLIQQLRKAAGQ